MRIAQMAPLYESVPPKYYGGTERVVSYLTEELVRQGNDVTLFASFDSVTSAKLVSICDRSLRMDQNITDQLALHFLLIETVFKNTSEFDIIHSHIDYLAFPLMRRLPGLPCITTLHGRLDLPEVIRLYQEYTDIPLVSISNAQREPIQFSDWQGTVYHGLPADLYKFYEKPGDYLAFLGRISPEKRVDIAIEIAKGAGMPLKIAAKVGQTDKEYYESIIKPLLNNHLVEFVGEIGEKEKNEFLGNASALIFPIDWPEPFGLVMIEAMACGTPVITRPRGSIPEIIEHGVSGYIFDKTDDGVEAVKNLPLLSRKRCRQVFEERFTVERMAADYTRIYREVIERKGIVEIPI